RTILVVLAGIILLSLSPTVQERTRIAVDEINAYYSGSKNTSVGRRLYMWEGAFKMFLENPVLGVGTGGYQNALAKYRDDPSLPDIVHPHNSFLYMASSYGIVGLTSFSWLLIVFLKKGWSARDTIEGFVSFSYGAVLLIGSLTDTQILSVSTGMMFALLTGMRDEHNE
ncbi:MAG: O-antigen ligase family protein, partial [Thermodesulfovibrionia bacterium]|nr:O-antigen ligase family protein [Thermodesulfovibrionia bacterium]